MAVITKTSYEGYKRTGTVADGNGAYIALQTDQNAVFDEENNVTIPIQVPAIWKLENMRENTVSGTGSFQEALLRGNDLKRYLCALAEKLPPGGEMVLPLQAVLRKPKTSQEESHKEVEFKF